VRDARHLWLETQDTNCAAIAFYERLGFSIVGFDRSLYLPGPHAEAAVFMAMPALVEHGGSLTVSCCHSTDERPSLASVTFA
jgi:ribosomal protein S18 acetylase RimI-like enzyme